MDNEQLFKYLQEFALKGKKPTKEELSNWQEARRELVKKLGGQPWELEKLDELEQKENNESRIK